MYLSDKELQVEIRKVENASSTRRANLNGVYFASIFKDHGNVDRLFQLLNLDLPGLERVKTVYQIGDVEKALDELILYYKWRCEHWSVVSHTYTSDKSVALADHACNNTVGNFGGAAPPEMVYFGPSGINWTDNPFWETDSDTEWIWGLHRQPFWLSLAWAYTETREEKYAQAWVAQFESWLKQCKFPC